MRLDDAQHLPDESAVGLATFLSRLVALVRNHPSDWRPPDGRRDLTCPSPSPTKFATNLNRIPLPHGPYDHLPPSEPARYETLAPLHRSRAASRPCGEGWSRTIGGARSMPSMIAARSRSWSHIRHDAPSRPGPLACKVPDHVATRLGRLLLSRADPILTAELRYRKRALRGRSKLSREFSRN